MPRRTTTRPGAAPRYFRSSGEHAAAIGMLGATVKDLTDFQHATQRVYELMRDGQWHTVQDIRDAAQQWEASRRMRELRQCGYIIERESINKGRSHRYRLTNPEETSTEEREAETFAQGAK